MKAVMNGKGLIVISAETGAEAFALKQWVDKASIRVNDMERMLNVHISPVYLQVDATDPEEEQQ